MVTFTLRPKSPTKQQSKDNKALALKCAAIMLRSVWGHREAVACTERDAYVHCSFAKLARTRGDGNL